MTTLLLLGLLLGAPPAKTAHQPGREQLESIAAKMRGIESLQVSLHQEKTLAAFDDVIRTNGTLAFARPQKLVLDLDGAGGSRIVINDDKMSVHYKALGKTEVSNLHRDPRARAVAEHLFLLLRADPAALEKVYDIKVVKTQPLVAELAPRPEALAAIIKRVRARFDARGFVDELTIEETNGDQTLWRFENPVINAPIPEELFSVAKP